MLLKIIQVLITLRFSTFFNLKPQLKDTESASKSKLIELLTQLKGFKIVATSILVFKQIESEHKIKYENFCSTSKWEIIINGTGIGDVFKSIYTTIITDIQKPFGKAQTEILIQSLIILLVFQSIIL